VVLHSWWETLSNERFWLEVTDRLDLGVNLKAPQFNEHGKEFWSYSLVPQIRDGDRVFHYRRQEQAIVGVSTARGSAWSDQLVWAARGTSARGQGIVPHPRAGWYLGLESYAQLPVPVTLDEIRSAQPELQAMLKSMKGQVGEPLYFPFEITQSRPLRPMQGYMFKLPAMFVARFPSLAGTAIVASKSVPESGSTYRPADQELNVAQRDPFFVDPALVERGMRSHARTQNALAEAVSAAGHTALSPRGDEPSFDLAWVNDGALWVVEVKSITDANEEKQLRLGLGQVLRYQNLLSKNGAVHAVLAVERQPTDVTWLGLCDHLGVKLVWPECWSELLAL
jgi:hypothetical protein